MKKFILNGVEFCDFGPNNYSHGMHLVTAYPMPENIITDVLDGKYHGIYLNPSAPCTDEFFGVFGTEEQYDAFREDQRKCQISCKMMPYLKVPLDEFHRLRAKFEREYKDWWEFC